MAKDKFIWDDPDSLVESEEEDADQGDEDLEELEKELQKLKPTFTVRVPK